MRLQEVAKRNKRVIKRTALPVLQASLFVSDLVGTKISRPEVSDDSDYIKDKAQRAAEFVGNFLAQQADLSEAQFRISDRPENQAYLNMVASSVHRRLNQQGITSWQVDMESSLEAGMIPNPNGYGNQIVKVPGPAQLVLRRIIEQPEGLNLVPSEPNYLSERLELEQVAA
ncbi:MAG TPA: hypothetical protein VH234_04020 [Candidatus Saccharimonadales bacterium]|jgi:hypothetical protein|nr:hypothetical protein [Candidatus Saccharimonadales bacterium]